MGILKRKKRGNEEKESSSAKEDDNLQANQQVQPQLPPVSPFALVIFI